MNVLSLGCCVFGVLLSYSVNMVKLLLWSDRDYEQTRWEQHAAVLNSTITVKLQV